ncbi:flagellar filament capping protein FliD [Pseudomonas mangiferae]|uniref:Flagellar hook-associated protein 2 n=1 Tax=Pseudomonas mangiferae TaxID=2593654 RepID=A0A553GY69_9PSED|nr:flagellar filament capping protein FliD [Pseudomonas mangiferae]TRX74453.1 branched-chain alpha-keto acid dehydrogenase subunit E2 [Pseudomonas mangiferae]
MAGISGLGGSGIDIDSIVSASVAAEKAPKYNQITKVQSQSTTKLTALGTLKSAISTFQTALSALNSPSSFLARTATSSNTTSLTADATQSAVAGSYKIQVSQLASSSKVALSAVASSATKFNEGTLKIDVGGTEAISVAVDSTNNTLAGMRDAINKQGSSQGITATIVTDSQGARLVLSSNKMGEGKDITVTGTSTSGTDTSLESLTFPGTTPTAPNAGDYASTDDYNAAKASYDAAVAKGGKTLSSAQSAKLTIDGLPVVSDSNTVTTALDGVSLNLKATTAENTPLTLTVAQDTGTVKTNVQKFVDAYNAMIDVVNTQTKVTTVANSTPVVGALVGDATARTLVSTVRNELVASQGKGTFTALAQLGITTKADGKLSLDSDKLDAAISKDFAGVASYFTGDNGLASRLTDKLSPFTSTNGVIDQRTTILQNNLKSADAELKDLNTRMTALSARLYEKYNTMDSLISKLTSTSSSLASSLAALPGVVKS